MRDEAARGCKDAVRVWDDELVDAGTQVRALVLATTARTRGFDLVLAGAASLSSAGGQLACSLPTTSACRASPRPVRHQACRSR